MQVVWNGLTHTAEGMANLSVTPGGNLLVDNLGSSGCDGFSVNIPDPMPGLSMVHSLFLEPSGPQSPPPGATTTFEYRGTLGGMADQEFASLDIAWGQGGTVGLDPHFDNIGSSGYDLVMYRNGTVVGSSNGLSAGDLTFASSFFDNVEKCYVYCEQFNEFEVTFANAGSLFLAGAPGPQVDEIILLPVRPLLLPTTYDTTTVRAMNISRLEWFNETAVQSMQGADFCNGDGGDQMGCTNCPCSNNAPVGSVGGCHNSVGRSAKLISDGSDSVTAATLCFRLQRGVPGSFAMLLSGSARAPDNPLNPCFTLNPGSGTRALAFDGLRCAVGAVLRHGGRAVDANGDVGTLTTSWGYCAAGFPNHVQFLPGHTRYFQVIYRDAGDAVCGRGLNTSQGVAISFAP